MNKFCKCGCGQEIVIKPHHSWYGIPDYIMGHNAPNKGRKFGKEVRNNMSKASKKRWKNQEYKEKMVIAHKGQIPWNKGKTNIYSEETLEKISKALIKHGLGRKSSYYKMLRKKATPLWADKNLIALYYIWRDIFNILLAPYIRFEVDHIIPRNGKTVCGLHVENNLQILICRLNNEKHDKYPLTQEEQEKYRGIRL